MSEPSLALGEDFPDIRAAVRRICENFPGAYWREREAREEYPDAFVRALTEAGYLGALIPERYGGLGASNRFSVEAQVRLGAADYVPKPTAVAGDETFRRRPCSRED